MTVMQPLETAGCGCDALDLPQGLTSIAEALDLISDWVAPLPDMDCVALDQAQGRILAQAVTAQTLTPPFDNSAMDGYAVRSTDFSGPAPWRLKVTTCVRAGSPMVTSVIPGEAVQLFTGAPLPLGVDAVVMQEHVTRIGDHITLTNRPKPKANIRYAGEDMAPGQQIITSGQRLGAAEIAVLAAAGCSTVVVQRRPRVAILTTGDEVRAPGTDLDVSAIWDVNAPMLTAAIRSSGGEVMQVVQAGDSLFALRDTLATLAHQVDMIVTTGGISVGAADFVKPAIEQLSGKMAFSGVAVKPGKPVSFGKIGSAYWLGLPGNPVSAFVTWTLFGSRLMNGLSKRTTGQSKRRHVVTAAPLNHRTGRCELRLATLSGFDGLGREVVSCPADTQSARVSRLTGADGLVFIPADTDTIPEGGLVEFMPFKY
ncbi:gephyrin-like molybdotransferase Glp [Parasedimentitalea huanghaiensis]|uniref:Molybdopterin molybdenumtransferase n=1 Tax=Parasedimentitalea huanghaiensis TaxID=2682100 RepID=A0A6L6WM67_9RHOB|nr:gephyrin-like molybdotransferase Glp [Zongyanglinia huanghaiensis]MVO18420.1 molybdopterin molybdenumtransferase MoeA [Zongyanglinia huanghaiensis]